MKTNKILLLIMLVLLSRFTYSATTANCSINAGVDQTICLGTATLTGDYSGTFPAVKVTTWSQISGPSATITTPSALVTTVTGLLGGNSYKFRLSSTCEDGSATYNEVNVNVSVFPTTFAGNDTTLCTGTIVNALKATALKTGETGAWSVISGSGLAISSPTNRISNVVISSGSSNTGPSVLRWTVTNTATSCTAYDELTITKNTTATPISAGNTPVTVSGCYNSTTSYTLSGSYANGGTNGTWSVVSGPNMPTFGSVNTHNTAVSNLIPGTYILKWTVTGGCTTGSATVQLNVSAAVGSVSASSALISGNPTMPYCTAPSEIVLLGSAYNADLETVTWTKLSGNAGCTITSPNSRNTTITGFDGVTTCTFSYKITNILNPTCLTTSSTASVSFEAGQTLAISTAKPFVTDCGASTALINITQTGATTPQWSVISGPVGYTPTAYANISANAFTVTGLTLAGTYLVRVKKVVGNCTTLFDEINVVVSKSPTASNAGSDLILACNSTTGELIGNTPAIGTGRWTQVSGPSTATIAAPTTPRCGISGLTNGTYQFRWTITSGPKCPTTQDDVLVRIASTTPTTANAGIDQTICNTTPLHLDGNVALFEELGTWTVAPSSGVVFSDVNSPKAIVTGLSASTIYTFTWKITNSCGFTSDNVVVTTNATVGPVASLAGSDQCLAAGTTTATLAGNNPSPGTGTWTKLTGGSATITNAALYNSSVTGMTNGTYTFEWAITRNACTITRDTVMITISAAVTTANAGLDQLTICGNSATLAANTPTVGTGLWTQVGGAGGAVITTPTSPTSTVTGLMDGLYSFRWTITNGACFTVDDVSLFASTPPTTPLAGADINVCGATSTTLAANTITTGTGYWSLISGPNAPVITNNALPTTTITGLVTGEPYILRWNSRNGLCDVLYDEVQITMVPAANAGSAQTLCGTTTAALTGNANTSGTWTFVSPAQTTETMSTTSPWSVDVSNLIPGITYTFKYSLTATGCSTSSNVTVIVPLPPTTASAGPNIDVCLTGVQTTATVTMAGNIPTTGTGAWARVAPVGGTITTASLYNTTITGIPTGIYVYSWTITNGTCTTIDYMTVHVSKITGQSAGLDQSICGTSATLAATAASSGTGTWTQVGTTPNIATIASAVSNTSAVTGLIPGDYTFRWTITDGTCSPGVSDDMILSVAIAPTTPNAGVDQTVCNVSTVTLAGNTISTGTGTWSQVSGPNTATITSANSPASTLTGMITGTYVYRWTASNGACTPLTDDVTIVNLVAPTASNAGSDFSACLYTPFNLAANTASSGTGLWTQISGNSISFTDATSPTTTITGATSGSYTFRWTITNGICTASTDDVILTIDQPSTIADAGLDQAPSGTSVTMAGNTISGGNGLWTKISGPNGAVITTPNSPTSTITGLEGGTYVYRWTSTNGTCSSYDEMSIVKATISCVKSNKMITPVIK
ncbi:MAG: hypothetical protein WCG93_12300 [Paludibacter sp.]